MQVNKNTQAYSRALRKAYYLPSYLGEEEEEE
jgi:hypothetical protein